MRLEHTVRIAIVWAGVVALLGTSALERSAAAPAQISRSASTDVLGGKIIYEQKCEPCHFSTTDEKKIGPGLAGLMKRARFKDGRATSDESLRRMIERGGKDMPGFRNSLKEKQVRDLIAYVKTL